MINKAVAAAVEDILSEKIIQAKSVSGGDINEAHYLQTAANKYFIKINSAERFPGMFEREAESLKTIAKTGTTKTPEIIAYGEAGDPSYLLMEWIDAARPDNASFAKLGEGLANLHLTTATTFGFTEDNYIGSLPQRNKQHQSWSDFYIKERLFPLVNMAVDSRKLGKSDMDQFDKLYAKLPELFEPEQPALIHGDLWSGNFLISTSGTPYLIDPAVYFGHREMDLALTTLFGGFGGTFYEAYQHHYPLIPGFQQRIKLWCLYPLLVHVNLFGGGYVQQLRSYLKAYS